MIHGVINDGFCDRPTLGILWIMYKMSIPMHNQAIFKLLIDKVTDPVHVISVDDDYRLVYLNDSACAHWGLPREKLLTMSVPDWDPNFNAAALSELLTEIKKNRICVFETDHRLGDGLLVPVEITAGHLSLAGREYLYGYIKRINRVKVVDYSAENRKREISALIEGAVDYSVFTIDTTGNITSWNDSAERMYGYPHDEIIGKNFAALLAKPAIDDQQHRQTIEMAQANGRSQSEGWGIRQDGQAFWRQMVITPASNISDQPSDFIVLNRDLSERVHVENALRSNAEKLQAMFDLSQVGMVCNALEGRFVEANPAFLKMLGYQQKDLTSLRFQDITPKQYTASDSLQIELLRTCGCYGPYEKEYVARNGQLVPVRLNGVMITDHDGEELIWSLIEDISQEKATQHELQLAASVFHSIQQGVLITDATGIILAVNAAFTEITGFAAEDVIGKTPKVLSSNIHDFSFYAAIWQDIKENKKWSGEIWNKRKNGEVYLQSETINAVYDDNGQLIRYVAIFSDITEIRRKDARIKFQTYHDTLTGLANRFLFHDRLELAIEEARQDSSIVGMLCLDIDRFKEINDKLGHKTGDALLNAVAQRLLAVLRKRDTLARLGGDEFLVLVTGLENPSEIAEIAESILQGLVQPFGISGQTIHTGASIGIALFPQDGNSAEALMMHADAAMYQAKSAGRGRYHFFDSNIHGQVVDRITLAEHLRHALTNEEFEIFYQPKICLKSEELCGAEALIRWRRPGVGLVPPDQFIPVAEENGFIVPIGAWVIREVCRQINRWKQERRTPICIAINLSALQFKDKNLPDYLEKVMREEAVQGSELEIEVTESAVMQDADHAIAILRKIQNLGVRVAVDDFGTGYSSLAYLKRLPIDSVKIDRSFVMDIGSDPEDAAIVQAIVALGCTLKLETIAEGVETKKQVNFLREIGCDVAQGYHYAKPMPADLFSAWVTKTACVA